MNKSYILLSDLSYAVGLIGLIELEERLEIANWLYGDMTDPADPRGPLDCNIEFDEPILEEDVFRPMRSEFTSTRQDLAKSINPVPEVLQFLVLKRWHFTIGDPDCAPSVPHGHENAKTQKWPKLNPYIGKVFTAMHSEDRTRRLSREEMKAL